MQIALLSPLYESVPPKLYGGTERVVANLCRGLTEMGHDVTLFASGDSRVATELIATVPEALRLTKRLTTDPGAYHVAQLAAVARRRGDFDVIHNHMDYFGFPLAALPGPPLVSTLHGRLDSLATRHVLRYHQGVALVSISDNQRAPAPEAHWVATVHHGLALDDFTFCPTPGDYLAFLGRISPEKRPDLASCVRARWPIAARSLSSPTSARSTGRPWR
jgi:glycosyltransferase involved in cell wall biosynthesis